MVFANARKESSSSFDTVVSTLSLSYGNTLGRIQETGCCHDPYLYDTSPSYKSAAMLLL